MAFSLFRLLNTLIGLVTMFLNILVFVSIINVMKSPRVARTGKTVYVFLGYLTFVDFCHGVSMSIVLFYPSRGFDCLFYLGIAASLVLASLLGIALVTIDRYIFILYGLYYRKWISFRRACASVFTAGVLSISTGMSSVPFLDRTKLQTSCSFLILGSLNLKIFLGICLIFMIVVIIIFNAIVFQKTITTLNNITIPGTNVRINVNWGFKEARYCPQKQRAYKFLILTSAALLLTWIPFIAIVLLQALYSKDSSTKMFLHNIASYVNLLGNFNSILNPIIYSWWKRDIRKKFKKIIRFNIKPEVWTVESYRASRNQN